MSTWISRRVGAPLARLRPAGRAVALLLAVAPLVAACMSDAGGADRPPPTRIGLTDDAVVIAGPLGYCVDRSSSRASNGGAFVLLGSCAALSRAPFAPAPAPLAVLSAAVSERRGDAPAVAASTDRLAAFFGSRAGRAALSRSGRAASVEVLRAFARDGMFFLRVRDASGFSGPRVAPEYWRALFDQDDRIVTLTVLGLHSEPISAAEGLRTLERFIARVGAANRGG